MKNLKVKIIDPKTLELEERGEIGDRIDLAAIQNVDNNKILEAIKNAKDDEYRKLMLEEKEKFENQKQIDLLELQKQMTAEKQEIKDGLQAKIVAANTTIEALKRNKASLQTKRLGEDLEKWCNQEYINYSVGGAFDNCKWQKDNEAKKEENDEKGTKADYIFSVFLDNDKKNDELLISVCCEMKSESPDSQNTKKNESHYKKLDADRQKKNCNYSLLISELEWDSVNDSPIKKISDYENMYLVRPSYFMTFISLIKALANKYQDLIKQRKAEDAEFKEKEDILKEFEDLKNTYLDKPLEALSKKVNNIIDSAKTIHDSSRKIIDEANSIIDNEIDKIKEKIDRFTIKTIANKVAKLAKKNSIKP